MTPSIYKCQEHKYSKKKGGGGHLLLHAIYEHCFLFEYDITIEPCNILFIFLPNISYANFFEGYLILYVVI